MIKRIKNILKTKSEIPVSFIGSIDEFGKDKVRGWIAFSDKEPLNQEIVIKVTGGIEIVVDKLEFREDLLEHGIANGFASYEVTYPEVEASEREIEILVNKVSVFHRKVSDMGINTKNKDPYFNNFYTKSLDKNRSLRLDDGLNIQLLYASEYEKAFCSSYFYRITNSKNNKGHELEIGQNIISKIYSNDEVSLIINSRFKTTVELIFFNVKGEITFGQRVDVTPGWRVYKVDLNIFNYSDLETSVRFVLSFDIDPAGFVDLGAISIAQTTDDYYLDKPKINKNKIHSRYLKLINSDLNACRLSDELTVIKRKQLLAPGVVYEAKDSNKNRVQAKIGDGGLDFNIGSLISYSRVSYSIDISSMLKKPILGTIELTSENENCLKAIYIYAKGDKDKIANKFKVKSENMNGLLIYKFVLDFNSVINLLSDTGGFYEYRLAVEFNSNCNLENFKVNLWQDDITFKEEVFESLEDSAISSQLDVISGYYDICLTSEEVKTTTELQVKQIAPESVDIVIPVYNAKEFVIKCLDSILRHTTMKYRIILMDDCSSDGVSEVLDQYAAENESIHVIHHAKNTGYTANVNAGFDQAKTEWVLLLNSDTEVTPFWLENIFEATKLDDVAIVGPLGNAASWQSVPNVFSDKGGWDFNLLPDGISANDIAYQLNLNARKSYPEAGVLNGFCQLINRKAFYDVGRLDEASFPKGYGEENDLCARFIKSGYKLLVATNSYVYHHKSKSFGHETRGELSKKGNAILKEKHPDYDWGLVSKKLYNHEDMIVSRKVVSALFEVLK